MGLMNCRMKVAIVYTSVTGNTEELAERLYQSFLSESNRVHLYQMEDFPISELNQFDAIIIGTYTWGDGEIPREMWPLFDEFETCARKDVVTAVFGTGDSFYPNFCGAVDLFRDMLYVHTNLAATLKVELLPQERDERRCQKFIESIVKRIRQRQLSTV